MNLTIGKTQNMIVFRSPKSSRNSNPQVQSINVAADPKQEAQNWLDFLQGYWVWFLGVAVVLVGMGGVVAFSAHLRDKALAEINNTKKEVLQNFLKKEFKDKLTDNEIYNLVNTDHFSIRPLIKGGPDIEQYLPPDRRKNYATQLEKHLGLSITDSIRQSIISSVKTGI